MMIITTTRVIHSTIVKIFLLFASVLIVFFFALTHGITIRHIQIPGLKIDTLYIKLDKKLTVSADTIEVISIKKEGRNINSIREIEKIADWIEFLPHYFDHIQIDNLLIGKRRLHILYLNDIFYIDNDALQVAAKISYHPDTKKIAVDLHRLLLKDPHVTLVGKFTYDIPLRRWRGKGHYSGFGIEGSYNVVEQKNRIHFILDSKPFASLKPLVDYLNPIEPIKEWIYPRIPAKKYILHRMNGEIFIKKDGGIVFDPARIEASATAYNAKIHFQKGVTPVVTPRIDISYKNDVLSFKLSKPTFAGKPLDGSHVEIRELSKRSAKLDAHIVVEGAIDDDIVRLLASYDINLPFVQTEGKTEAIVDLTIKLVGVSILKYHGDYRTERATLLFDRTISIPVHNLHVISKKSDIVIERCRIKMDPYIDASLRGTIDLHAKRGLFEPLIHRMGYSLGQIPLFDMREKEVPVVLDYKNGTTFSAEKLALKLLYRQGGAHISLLSISKLHPYFTGPLKPLQKGRIDIDIDKKETKAIGRVTYENKVIFQKGRPLETFVFNAMHNGNKTDISIDDAIKAVLEQNNVSVTIRESDIYIDRLLDTIEDYLSRDKNDSAENGHNHTIAVEGYDGTLFYDTLQLPCRKYSANIETNPLRVKFITKHRSGEIHGLVTGDRLHIAGDNLPDYIVRGLTTIDAIHGGTFSFEAKGSPHYFKGTIRMQDTVWAKNALYNNILATLNTIPAVLTLKNPGFSKKGFKIKKGAIEYHYKKPTLYLDTVLLKGESANVTGAGAIDFKKKSVDMKLQVHFLESLTNVLGKIPVAGYLIFGKDKTIAITLKVNGPLKNPKVTTETAKEIIKAPLNILQRTLSLPFKLFK